MLECNFFSLLAIRVENNFSRVTGLRYANIYRTEFFSLEQAAVRVYLGAIVHHASVIIDASIIRRDKNIL